MISLSSVTPSLNPLNMSLARQTKMTERLASGRQLNRAADDSAGFAITSTFQAQIRGAAQARANSQDSINLLRTADGGLSQIHDKLRRMRELLIQANNDTYTASDREKIQEEVEQIIKGVDEVAEGTQFNDKILLRRLREVFTTVDQQTLVVPGNGTVSYSGYIPSGAISTTIRADFSGPFGGGNPFPDLNVTMPGGTVFGSQALDGTAPPPSVANGNTGSVILATGDPLLNGEADSYSYTGSNTPIESMTFTNPTSGPITVTYDNNSPAVGGAPPVTPGGSYTVTISTTARVSESNGLQDPRSPHAVYLQLGGNEGQIVRFELPDASALALNLLGMDFTGIDTVGSANRDALVTDYFNRIDDAIAAVSTSRARVGAMENRLQANLSNLETSEINMTESTSRIMDTDVASAMSDLIRTQVTTQFGTALIAQTAGMRREQILSIMGARSP